MIKKVQVVYEDNTTSDIDLLSVDTKVFVKEFKFLENYDDVVECLETGKIYKARYRGAIVELFDISNNIVC